jgi:hypothetical protein
LTDGRDKALSIPNESLAGFYDPIKCLGMPLKRIKNLIRPKVQKNFDELQQIYAFPARSTAAKDSLLELYVNMAIASPAICALRLFHDEKLAESFGKAVAYMFDKPEAIAAVELACEKSDEPHYHKVLEYCVHGNLAAVIDEYAHVLNEKDPQMLSQKMLDALNVATASYAVDTYSSFTRTKKKSQNHMRSHFAAAFHQTRIDSDTVQRKENLRTAFNSPFRPFVLATTSIGQEGLDFHNYARKIMHWNLPHNPIDLEQREGRINRFKCLAIRQSLGEKYKEKTFASDVWNEIFDYALSEKRKNDPELVPYWCLTDGGSVKIERFVPMYPYSRDLNDYQRLLQILSLYRVTLGHARQEDLLDYLLKNLEVENIKKLFIDLSPFTKKTSGFKS